MVLVIWITSKTCFKKGGNTWRYVPCCFKGRTKGLIEQREVVYRDTPQLKPLLLRGDLTAQQAKSHIWRRTDKRTKWSELVPSHPKNELPTRRCCTWDHLSIAGSSNSVTLNLKWKSVLISCYRWTLILAIRDWLWHRGKFCPFCWTQQVNPHCTITNLSFTS